MKIKYEGRGYECVLRDGLSESDTVYENHCHPFYEIIMVVCGKIAISIEDKRFTVSAGEIVFIRPAEYHSFFSLDEAQYRRFTLLFEDSLIPVGIRDRLLSKTEISPVCHHSDMAALFSRLDGALRRDNVEDYSRLIDAIITELFYIIADASVFSDEEDSDGILQSILEYIAEHITERVLLEDVAAHVLLSKSAVCHIFKNRMNTSPKQYILQKKITYAAGLIKKGASANEAARMVGYENYAGFYKMYKKFLSEAPSERKDRYG